ncbi:glycosyltransferase [Flavonifractor sp. An92]|uniref:glycosyltransferase n=1 Tax=Flavonifractor sp. An92 TaxID=1965666 RepID=UPI0023B98831|nr:glycosyltransferase [Flavonifractor sp. An92]
MDQLICLADEPWSSNPSRTQQLLSRMKGTQILYFEPASGLGDLRRRPGRRVRPGLVVYTLPPVWEGENEGLLFRAGRRRLLRFVEAAMARHHMRDPVLWCATPRVVHLAEELSCRGVVYDCAQDWSHLPVRWESDLCLSADLIFAASPELAEHISPCSDNVALLPNGANCSVKPRSDEARPAALRGVQGPILGYAGTLWQDLDLEPVLRVARAYPQAKVVLVGRREGSPMLRRLEREPNVIFTGEVSLAELPEYLGCFDVCMNLLRLGSPDNDVLPPRIFEYFSTGKPIVAMLLPGQVEEYPDVIYSAHTVRRFVELCGSALAESGSWASDRRLHYAEGGSWSCRAREVERIFRDTGLFHSQA